jgi:hypothetical protein
MKNSGTSGFIGLMLALAATGAAASPADLPQGGDPYLPPALRQAPTQASPSGAALQAKVEQKLRQTFDAADTARNSSLTREQAARAGWAMVVQEFDRIDTARSGRVSFEDVQRFVRARSAAR